MVEFLETEKTSRHYGTLPELKLLLALSKKNSLRSRALEARGFPRISSHVGSKKHATEIQKQFEEVFYHLNNR